LVSSSVKTKRCPSPHSEEGVTLKNFRGRLGLEREGWDVP
jgi:hypothetical protein